MLTWRSIHFVHDMCTSNGTAVSRREFDLIVWGATGFTGRLVAEYLATRYREPGALRWAIAGRSDAKLEQVRQGLGTDFAELPIIVADSRDLPSLMALAGRTKVVISTVGPYALYGSELVEACVASGTHYCDLAGEVQWIRRMIDRHHSRATETGAKIVHCCGFDSVPMDIGVWFLQWEAKKRYGEYCASIKLLVKAIKGGASGGTAASLVNLIEESRKDKAVAAVLVDPYGLNPEGERSGPDTREQTDIRFDELANAWTAPFVMAAINKRVVHRSNALLGYPWGRDFLYDEATLSGQGPGGWLKAVSVGAGLGALVGAASYGMTRGLLKRFVLPAPGEGPSEAARESGFFNLMQIGKLPDGSLLRSRITGDRDPGYGSTSKMLAESAVCLAEDGLPEGGGVLTPASAMAEPLLRRLTENAGLGFEVID